MLTKSTDLVRLCGISTGFPVLFPTPGQITHVLLTRAPLYSGSCPPFLARLACVRHAASVDSEPGSNSQDFLMRLILRWVSPTRFALKTELTRKILLAVRFLFSKNQIGSQASKWRQKNRLNLLGGVFNVALTAAPFLEASRYCAWRSGFFTAACSVLSNQFVARHI